ncbi:aminotransferase class IV family protein [Parasedimentitalea psychrophila]|uniref:Probable branched-chain-amino-acid aminotransferase n=1 Tax=Parasedimentitalea psychrophila TaxID=2997337 RepID=A0A9Y2KUP1_9RHOB|nr:aminotransferase class IV family protein [Parasedimentitalea psychrophila]WIY23486.1 aminotransferase class IV family protein [Parasedimentitalea psychrophila]
MENQICPPDDPDFRLIETFGYCPDQGIARAALHVQRLQASAAALGFDFDRRAVVQQMQGLTSDVRLRCRLTLGRAGDLQLTTAPMPAKLERMRFVIAATRLHSDDALLRHKTTRREIFDRARAALPRGIDEAAFLNERDEVCEGTITNIVITTHDGDQLTPPLTSGCLPGVYRQSQLNMGGLREAVLTLADLKQAHSIYLVNALRGATQAIWAPQCSQFAQFA